MLQILICVISYYKNSLLFARISIDKRTSKTFLSVNILNRACTSVGSERGMVKVQIDCKMSVSSIR